MAISAAPTETIIPEAAPLRDLTERPMKVAALILTKDEERNIARCIQSLEWCEEIVVLDSGSQDATCELARRAGARVIHRPFDTFAQQRNAGLELAGFESEWILHVDADEVFGAPIAAEIGALEPPSHVEAFEIPCRMILNGRWIRYSSSFPVYQTRLVRRTAASFHDDGHGQKIAVAPDRLGRLTAAYDHYNFSKGLTDWLQRHARYAFDDARAVDTGPASQRPTASVRTASGRRQAQKRVARRILPLWARPVARFLHSYVMRGGWRDGLSGYQYSLMLACYEAMIAAQILEGRSPSTDHDPSEPT